MTEATQTADAPTFRRCGRCLERFPLEPGTTRAATDWWACDPCRAKLLLGSKFHH